MNVIHTNDAPAAVGPYSQAVLAGNTLYMSGQIAIDPAAGKIVATTIEDQAEQCCKNIGAILEAAGCGYDKVIKTTCFLADMGDFAVFNESYGSYFTSKPAISCIAVNELPKV